MERRYRAALIQVAISAVAAGSVVALAWFIWYPHPLLALQGGGAIIGLLVLAAFVFGPMLTFLVFTPGKARGALIFDLIVIGVVQVVAFCYGTVVVYSGRPAYLAFAHNQFYVVTAIDAEGEPPARVVDAKRIVAYGPRVVFAKAAGGKDGGMAEVMGALLGDPAQAVIAKNYEVFPYSLETLAREALKPDDVLPYLGHLVIPLAQSKGFDARGLQYFLVNGRAGKGIALVAPGTGALVGIVEGDLVALTSKN